MNDGLESQSSDSVKLEWTVHPIRKNWKVSASLVLFLLVLFAVIYYSFNSLIFLILSVVFLVSSLSSFFFPTTYIIRDDCIVVQYFIRKLSRDWDSFKSYYLDRNGVLLSPFPYPSRLENFRGLYVKFDNNKAEVMDFIKGKIKKAGEEDEMVDKER